MILSKQSKTLIDYFSENNHLNYSSTKPASKKILEELYQEILEAYNYSKNFYLKTPTLKKITNVSQIIKPSSFDFKSFPSVVRKHIDETMMSELLYSFSLKDRNVKLYFIVENENIESEIVKFNKYVKRIITWLYILSNYASNECANTLMIYFYFSSLKKELPETNINILNQENVNTAFTRTCPKNSEIVIFRKEEWFKVLIHETFHNFGLDFSMMDNSITKKCILSIFPVNSDVNSFEAYTEFWAEIINALFCSFYIIKNKSDKEEFLYYSNLFIDLERTYSFFQLNKVLEFMGLTYLDLYSKSKRAFMLRLNLYKENTNVLSYYIIKTILLNNYQGFLEWCKTNNLSLLSFNKTPGNLTQYCKFISKNYKTSSMLHGINLTSEILSNIKMTNKNYRFIVSNLRMSICELG